MSTPIVAPYQTRTTCRACGSRLYGVMGLGSLVPSDFLAASQPDPPALPLDLQRCEGCGLVQLKHTVHADRLFRRYWYQSGINESMKAELQDVVTQAQTIRPLRPDDLVVDVGANDGTLLSYYPVVKASKGLTGPVRCAYEPAYNLFEALRPHAEILVADFFPSARDQMPDKSVAILTSIACFYAVDDPKQFVQEVDRVLTEDGVWVVQFQDLAQQVQTGAFDNIVFEHLMYYSLRSFAALLKDFNLDIYGVQPRAINGGSLRVYVRREAQVATQMSFGAVVDLGQWLQKEDPLTTTEALEAFAWQADQTRSQLQEMVGIAARSGPVDLYAASTKSSTLLQYCGIDHTLIRQAVERTVEKVGRVTSGTRIPIVNEHTWRADPARVTVLGAYQHTEMFLKREEDYIDQGGSFLTPLPHPRLISGGGR